MEVREMQDKQRAAVGLITREHEPLNLEFPFSALDGGLTKNEEFYVRNHFPEIPDVKEKTWKLKIEGEIEQPFEIGYEELLKMPAENFAATVECAGNSRVFLTPKASGVQWELGAIGTARWKGVPLRALLEKAGVKESVVEVVLIGADKGEIKDPPKSPGEISFARSLPLEKALAENILLAYEMNGEKLSKEHGFPVRAVVPGWYGMAWVKWLERIVVTKEPFTGYFQTADYSYWVKEDGLPAQMIPITEMQVKAEIARPAMHEAIPANSVYLVRGAAWSGEDAEISKVEVSTDGGKNWREAKLTGEARKYVWQMWEYDWQVPAKTGKYTLMARAEDRLGNVQPMKHAKERGGYLVNHVLPVEVEVR
jgi:DMSO/TMAO reductase YedYZ molybdopterin-dependent catalytic subunit